MPNWDSVVHYSLCYLKFTGCGNKITKIIIVDTYLTKYTYRYNLSAVLVLKMGTNGRYLSNRSHSRHFVVTSVYQATQQRHLAFQLFYEHTNDFTNKCEPDLFTWALTTSFVISHNSALSLCHHLSRALSILELMNENELQPIGKPIHFIFPNRRWEALNTRGEPIPEELQFTIPHFGGIRPLTSTGYWVNSLKRIDSFPGIAVHHS